MSALSDSHPIQQGFAFISLIEKRAAQQLLFRQLAEWGKEELTAAGAVFVEIARDASDLGVILTEIVEERIMTKPKEALMRECIQRIYTKALTGEFSRN